MRIIQLTIALLVFIQAVNAQENTLGTLLNDSRAYDGYTLFSPFDQKITYLINNEGKKMHSWEARYVPGHTVYLNEDGSLYRAGQFVDDPDKTIINGAGGGGIIERYDWNSRLLWEYEYSDASKRQHHDFKVMPNGNVLILAWEVISKEEAIESGRDPATLNTNEIWPDHIIEVTPSGSSGGDIVWEWHVWDHLIQDFDNSKDNFGIVADHPELIDLNHHTFTNADWNHINSIDYNEELDQIMLSVHEFNELWIIDHSTTTEEAKSHEGGNSGKGGDLLYRWGNPIAYNKGTLNEQQLFGQHGVHWIPADRENGGKIILFNNGQNRPDGSYSSIDILSPTKDNNGNYLLNSDGRFGPDELDFQYTAPNKSDFFGGRFSSAQVLSNDNILVCNGPLGTFFEINNEKEVVWQYINPVTRDGILEQGQSGVGVNFVFHAKKYSKEHPAFENKVLTPGDPIEIIPQVLNVGVGLSTEFVVYPNPVNDYFEIPTNLTYRGKIQVYNMQGMLVKTFDEGEVIFDVSSLVDGLYVITNDKNSTKKVLIAKRKG